MAIVVNNMLLVRRINDLHGKRDALVERQDRIRSILPDWTIEPLRLAGMATKEIEAMLSEVSAAEQNAGLEDLEHQVERIEDQIEEAEDQLMSFPNKSLECVETVLRLAINRLRRQVSTDPSDVLYDYGEARVMSMLESAAEDLRGYLQIDCRAAG